MYSYRKNRHSCYKLTYHLVVVTKYRNKVITKEIFKRLEEIFKDIMENSWKCEIFEFNGEADYIHVLFSAPPQVELAKLINNLKTVSSRRIRKEFADHVNKYYCKPSFWNGRYLILTTGEDTIDIINEFLKEQECSK